MINEHYIDKPKPKRPLSKNVQNIVKETKSMGALSAELRFYTVHIGTRSSCCGFITDSEAGATGTTESVELRGCNQSPRTILHKYLLFSLFSLLLLLSPLQATLVDRLPFLSAKAQLPDVSQEMRAPGYWIARHPSPDKLILDSDGIDQLNSKIRKATGAVSQLSGHSSRVSGATIRNQLSAMHSLVSGMKLYDGEGNRVPTSFWQGMQALENRGAIPNSINVRFGFATSFAHQRLVPSLKNLNKVATDTEFDEIQNSGYDIGTPLVIYHESADGKWLMGSSSLTTGWFLKTSVGICSQSEWKAYQQSEAFVVVTSAKADLWADSEAKDYLGFQRMGMKLPLLGESGDYYRVRLPRRNADGSASLAEAYILKTDANAGYLLYTARNAIVQAFKMQGERYGWADMQGDWDCSSLLISIFRCFGIELPRNGANQALSGKMLHTFASSDLPATRRRVISDKAMGGITLLNMKGHIVLYLGTVDGNPYAIHDAWAYRSPSGDGVHQDVNVIAGTIVSGLDLGTGSAKGSLLERLLKVTQISR